MMLRASTQTMLCLSAQMKKSNSYELDFLCLVTVLDDIAYTMVVFVAISPRDLSDAKSIINSTG